MFSSSSGCVVLQAHTTSIIHLCKYTLSISWVNTSATQAKIGFFIFFCNSTISSSSSFYTTTWTSTCKLTLSVTYPNTDSTTGISTRATQELFCKREEKDCKNSMGTTKNTELCFTPPVTSQTGMCDLNADCNRGFLIERWKQLWKWRPVHTKAAHWHTKKKNLCLPEWKRI